MKKNKQILIAIALAVVFALCAAYGVYRILEPQRTTIYVFNDDYTTGTQVTADMLTPVQADASVIVAGGTADASSQFITSAEYRDMLQSGNSLRIDVAKGMPLMTSMLSLIGGNRIEMTMQSTAIAVTVSVDGVTGITNDLGPGARVNIYVTYGASGTTLLLENMRVLAVNKTTTNDIISATIEVDNSEAIKLIEAANRGTIYLGLVNGNGYQSVLEPNTDDEQDAETLDADLENLPTGDPSVLEGEPAPKTSPAPETSPAADATAAPATSPAPEAPEPEADAQ